MAPALSSRPNAATVWLNVDGTAQSSWQGRIVPAFPKYAGNAVILQQTVAHWLLRFNVTVTTTKPASMANVLQCVVGNSFGGFPGGGVADVGSFTNGEQPIVFTFAEYFVDETHLAYECLHEIGHAFGLDHQGQFVNGICVNPYLAGCFMGNPHVGTLIGWTKGTTPAGVAQDDVAVLGSVLGFSDARPSYLPQSRPAYIPPQKQ